jgi:RNA polymerase primary sigma factor
MMTLEDLEEALEELLPNGFEIDVDNNGQLIIYTGLTQDDDGDLVEYEGDDEDLDDEDLDDEDLDDEDEDEDTDDE